jgi:hypothetical protein
MKEAIELLEEALKEADRVEPLGIWDRERLDRAVGYVKEALEQLNDKEAV